MRLPDFPTPWEMSRSTRRWRAAIALVMAAVLVLGLGWLATNLPDRNVDPNRVPVHPATEAGNP